LQSVCPGLLLGLLSIDANAACLSSQRHQELRRDALQRQKLYSVGLVLVIIGTQVVKCSSTRPADKSFQKETLPWLNGGHASLHKGGFKGPLTASMKKRMGGLEGESYGLFQ